MLASPPQLPLMRRLLTITPIAMPDSAMAKITPANKNVSHMVDYLSLVGLSDEGYSSMNLGVVFSMIPLSSRIKNIAAT